MIMGYTWFVFQSKWLKFNINLGELGKKPGQSKLTEISWNFNENQLESVILKKIQEFYVQNKGIFHWF